MTRIALALALCVCVSAPAVAQVYTYKVLATSRTSTMQKEMQEAGEAGYRFVAVMGGVAGAGYQAIGLTVGKTAFGGSELVVITRKKK